jgi:hypothetical protein
MPSFAISRFASMKMAKNEKFTHQFAAFGLLTRGLKTIKYECSKAETKEDDLIRQPKEPHPRVVKPET